MLFLKLRNADILFGKKTLILSSYITNETLPTTNRVRIINKTDFVIMVLDADSKTFFVHMAFQKQEKSYRHY